MIKFLVGLVACLAVVANCDEGVNWALLVAGSNEYYNYRHQADVCHAYQILHKNGIPDERIIVMMYDDIAQNRQNPTKGIVINKPNGPDVYKGTVKDYTGKTVTPTNFLNILQGKDMSVGSGKTLKSGPNDNVFVYFTDHGAPGIVAFPDGSALHASQLNSALKNMFTHKQYKNMVVYIEACESGSMFENLLPENINIYATTAANSEESSYACYYDDKRQTYLGDLYSVNWMEDSDKEDLSKETLYQQFSIVKQTTNLSHVQQFGDLTMGKSFFVSQFQGESQKISIRNMKTSKTDAVRTEDVRMSVLQKRLENEKDDSIRQEIKSEIAKALKLKKTATGVMREIVAVLLNHDATVTRKMIEAKMKLKNHECYVPVVDHIIEKCFTLRNEYVMRNLYIMVNLCESGYTADQIKQSIDKVCQQKFEDEN